MGLLVTLTRMGAECDSWALGVLGLLAASVRHHLVLGHCARTAPRADVHMCVVPHPRPEGKKLNAGPEPEKRKPLDLLRFCRGRMKMKQQESGITRARKRVVVFFSTVQNLHGIAPTRSPNPSSSRALGIGTVHGQSTDPF